MDNEDFDGQVFEGIRCKINCPINTNSYRCFISN